MNSSTVLHLERGYTRINNEMLEALYRCKDLKLHEYKLLLCMIRHTNGYNCTEQVLKNSFLVNETGISKSHICDTIQLLLHRDIIFKKKDSYGINQESNFWKSKSSVQMEPSSAQREQKFRPDGTVVPSRWNNDLPQTPINTNDSAYLKTELKKEVKTTSYRQEKYVKNRREAIPTNEEWNAYIKKHKERIMFKNYFENSALTQEMLQPFLTKQFIDRVENANNPEEAKQQEWVMYKHAELLYREHQYEKEHGPMTKELAKQSCHHQCDGSFQIFQEDTYFWHTCEFKGTDFCLLSPEQKERHFKDQWKKKVFPIGAIPSRLQEVNLRIYNTDIQHRLLQYMENDISTKGLTLYGGVGVGKTSAFYLCLDYLYQKKLTAFLITSDQMNQAFFDKDTAIIQQMNQTKYLMIDDLGREYPVDFTMAMMEAMICNRYANGKITSYNTNLFKEQVMAKYPRLYDRQVQTNTSIIIPGRSLRKEN